MTSETDNPGQSIDYGSLALEAHRGIVRSVLSIVEENDCTLPGDHHFFIAFNTRANGVVMSKRLQEQYPKEMTVVLQHRFWDLKVFHDRFEVRLTFNNLPERLVIPFAAIKGFFDPTAQFALPLEHTDTVVDAGHLTDVTDKGSAKVTEFQPAGRTDHAAETTASVPAIAPAELQEPLHISSTDGSDESSDADAAHDDDEDNTEDTATVVELDAFRKK